jgi:hypothetical protein
MIANYGQASPPAEGITVGGKRAVELAVFVVDCDPHGLEKAGEVRRAGARSQGFADRVHEIIAGGQGGPLAPTHDARRQAPRPTFVTKGVEDRRQRLGRPAVEEIGGGLTLPVHAHVQRAARSKGEPAGVVIQLPRGHTEIQEDEIGLEILGHRQDSGVGKPTLDPLDRGLRKPAPCFGHGHRIAIHGEHPSAQGHEHRRVPPAAGGPVHDACGRVRQGTDLVHQYRLMIGHGPLLARERERPHGDCPRGRCVRYNLLERG